MKVRRTLLALSLLIAAFAAVPHTTFAAGTCPVATFCAGAAGADITPPVTTPMWGYTARQGVLASAGVADDMSNGFSKLGSGDISGFVAGLKSAGDEQFLHDKSNPDADRYDKTFVSNHGIHLRLFANAFVLQGTDGARVAVVQTDLGGLPSEVHQGVADRLQADGVGVDRDHLLIGATHTHQGPGGIFQYQGYALLGGDQFDPRVFEAVVGGITRAVERAAARITPAKMAWGQISTVGANRNRRVSPQWCENPENNCVQIGDNLVPGSSSPSTNDPLLTVIRLDRTNGVPIGAITNFTAHGTVGGDDNLLFSGDNQGWATRLVERGIADAYGQALPAGWEIVDALINGAQGDGSPIGDNVGYDWGGTQREYSQMEDAGHRQLDPAIAEWRALGSNMRSDVTVDSRYESLCFCGQAVDAPYLYDGDKIDKSDPIWDHVSPYASLGQAGVTGDDGTSSPVALPGQGHKMPTLSAVGTNPSITRVQIVRIGDLILAGVPGEPTVTAGRRIKAALLALPGHASLYSDVIIAGLANDYDSYFATAEEQTAYQYEGSFTLFGPQQVPLITEELAGLATRMIAGTAVPDCSVGADPAFCATHMHHPDVSATAFPPTPINIDATPRALTQPQRNIARFGVAEFVWQGGSPSAEWIPDQDKVSLQQKTGSTWTTIAGDAHDTATVTRFDKINNIQQWTAQWDVARDVAPGTYRFHITGGYGAAPGVRAPYALDSIEFAVSATAGMSVYTTVSPTAATVSAGYLQPDKARSFRWRPRFATTGTASLTIDRGGSNVTLSSAVDASGVTTFALQAGDSVLSARVTDGWGNSGQA